MNYFQHYQDIVDRAKEGTLSVNILILKLVFKK